MAPNPQPPPTRAGTAVLPVMCRRSQRSANLRRLLRRNLPPLRHAARNQPDELGIGLIAWNPSRISAVDELRDQAHSGPRPYAARFSSAAGQRHYRLVDFPDRERYRRPSAATHPVPRVWVLGGVISLFACVAFAELGSMFPDSGGQYVYLREAYGDLPAFLYGWMLFSVANGGTIAALAVASAAYMGQNRSRHLAGSRRALGRCGDHASPALT